MTYEEKAVNHTVYFIRETACIVASCFPFYFCSIAYRLSSATHKLAPLTFILHFPNSRFTSDCNFSFASSKELVEIIVDCESVILSLYITEKFNSY